MTAESPRGPPEDDFAGGLRERLDAAPADERVYRVALELTKPARVSEVATRADCSKNAARQHLNRLTEIGVLTKVTANPATFERNESSFAWRRRARLAKLSETEYKERLGELLAEADAYRDIYGVDDPHDLDPLEYSSYGDPEAVWLDISNWESVRTEIQELQKTGAEE